jgi:hypothetical protein
VEGHLLMSAKEWERKSVLELVTGGRLTLVAASRRLHLSYRQTLRVHQRYVEQGDASLVHRRRGQPSNRGYPDAFRDQVVKRYRARYAGDEFGPTLASEKLAGDGLVVDHETLRRWLLASGDWKKRRRRRAHRTRRKRKPHFGELVQMDGSFHNWFGRDRDKACLMNMVDDATGATAAAMRLLWQWIERYGIPVALYTDKRTVYITNREPRIEEQLADEEPMTAFGKACDKLGIAIIAAHSPQAKGRVERSNAVYQDRFLKELSLLRITTIESANKLLANGFTDSLNEKFAREPLSQEDYHRPVPKGVNLADVFSIEEERVVQNDWCIRHNNQHYQITKENTPLPKPKDKIVVRTRLDGSQDLLYRGKPLRYEQLSRTELTSRTRADTRPAQPRPHKKPPKKDPRPTRSPWRQNTIMMAADSGKKVYK